VAAFAAEHKQMAAEWVLPEVLLHQGRKSVKATRMSVSPAASQILTPAAGVIIRAAPQASAAAPSG
jgi:hypothetical protein